MPDPLIRGAVVMRDGRYDVVWLAADGVLVLMPVLRPEVDLACDVGLEFSDLVACGVPIGGAVIRARRKAPAPAEGHARVGLVPGRTMCRVVAALVRGEAEAAAHEKWSAERRHRRAAEERCVKLVG